MKQFSLLLFIFLFNTFNNNLNSMIFRKMSTIFEKINVFEGKFETFSAKTLLELAASISIIIFEGDNIKNYFNNKYDYFLKTREFNLNEIENNINNKNYDEIIKNFKNSLKILEDYFNSPIIDIENNNEYKEAKILFENIKNLNNINERHLIIVKNLIEKKDEYFKLVNNYFLILNSEFEDFTDLLNNELNKILNIKENNENHKIEFKKIINELKNLIENITKNKNKFNLEDKKKEFLKLISSNKNLIKKLNLKLEENKEKSNNNLLHFNKNNIINYSLLISGLFGTYKFYNHYKKNLRILNSKKKKIILGDRND